MDAHILFLIFGNGMRNKRLFFQNKAERERKRESQVNEKRMYPRTISNVSSLE